MAGGGGFAISRSRNGDERFYGAPVMRRQTENNHQFPQQNQQLFLLRQQQHQQPQIQRRHHQLLQQQQQHVQMQRHQQQQAHRPPPPLPPLVVAASADIQAENGIDSGDSRAALPPPPPFLPPPLPENVNVPPPPPSSQPNLTNLDRLLESVSPTVPASNFYEVSSKGLKSRGAEIRPFYRLSDLWESFQEWSVYGAGVPLLLNDQDSIVQYYVPYLSGMQLYVDPLRPLPRFRQPGAGDHFQLNHAAVPGPHGRLVFEYLEQDQPHLRQPFTDKIKALDSQFPVLGVYRSHELLPTSWLCVAWYPIYRIPVGPTLKDVEASFLTFHSLADNFKITQSSQPSTSGSIPNRQSVTLPAFGLASYKLRGSLMSPCGPHEREQENALLQAAGDWLNRLGVQLHDYQFFISHYSNWR